MDNEFQIPEDTAEAAIYSAMDAKRRARMALMHAVHRNYIPTRRDKTLADEIRLMVDTTLASVHQDEDDENPPEGVILAITGVPGAGKTTAIRRALKEMPELKASLLRVITPRPCTFKQLGRNILEAVGYELGRDLAEHLTWERVRKQLECNAIRFIWIDELQHAFEDKHEGELRKISDTIKNLVQRESWPVGFIVSGLPVVSNFLGRDRQLERRSRTMSFGTLTFPEHTKFLRHLMTTIVCDHAGMKLHAEADTDEFVHRLCHAAEGAFGVCVSLIQDAVLAAFDRDDTDNMVRVRDFGVSYAAERHCEPSQNVFLADDWAAIQPGNSRLRKADSLRAEEEAPRKNKKKGR